VVGAAVGWLDVSDIAVGCTDAEADADAAVGAAADEVASGVGVAAACAKDAGTVTVAPTLVVGVAVGVTRRSSRRASCCSNAGALTRDQAGSGVG